MRRCLRLPSITTQRRGTTKLRRHILHSQTSCTCSSLLRSGSTVTCVGSFWQAQSLHASHVWQRRLPRWQSTGPHRVVGWSSEDGLRRAVREILMDMAGRPQRRGPVIRTAWRRHIRHWQRRSKTVTGATEPLSSALALSMGSDAANDETETWSEELDSLHSAETHPSWLCDVEYTQTKPLESSTTAEDSAEVSPSQPIEATLYMDTHTSTTLPTMTTTNTTPTGAVPLAFVEGMALLRAMSRDDFAMYDRLEHTDTDPGPADTEATGSRVIQHHDPAFVDPAMDHEVTSGVGLAQDDEYAAGKQAPHEPDGDEHELLDLEQEVALTMHKALLLDTQACNMILLRIALVEHWSTRQEILMVLMTTVQRVLLLGDAGADRLQLDDLSCEIVLHALNKRLAAITTGTEFVRSVHQRRLPWNRFSLVSAMQLCEATKDLDLAMSILTDVVSNQERAFQVPAQVFQVLVRMTKRAGTVDCTANVMKLCLEECLKRGLNHLETDGVLMRAIQWPDRDRSGRRVDNTDDIRKLLKVLDSAPSYKPGYQFWKETILTCAKGRGETKQRWLLLRDAFDSLSSNVEDYWPDQKLFVLGLDVSEALNDPPLAADLVGRLVKHSLTRVEKWNDNRIDTMNMVGRAMRDVPSGHLSVLDLERAVIICLGDSKALRSSLESIFDLGEQIPKSFQQHLFELGVKGYASNQEPETAEALLLTLIDRGYNLKEETFGAVIHGFAVTNQHEQAQLLFEDMRNGDLPCAPGPSSYNGLILSHILSHSWVAALEAYNDMKRNHLVPLPSTHHAALLASFRSGGKEVALALVEEWIASKCLLSEATCKLAAKIALELSGKADDLSSDSIRGMVLRAKESNEDLDQLQSLREIMGSWQSAERKEDRAMMASIAPTELERRRQVAWIKFLESLASHHKLKANNNV